MTSHRITRCKHCLISYTYQTSGAPAHWYADQSNSSDYCKDCWSAIKSTLKSIPVKCEKFFEDVTDEDELKRVFEREEYNKENPVRLFGDKGPVVQEVGSSTYKISNRKITDSSYEVIVNLEGVKYRIRKWRNGSEPTKVIRPMERNLKTGEEKPWIEYTRY